MKQKQGVDAAGKSTDSEKISKMVLTNHTKQITIRIKKENTDCNLP